MSSKHKKLSNFIWEIADLLRGPYRPPQYERVMLPMTVLRRFDCVLKQTKEQVLAKKEELEEKGTEEKVIDRKLKNVTGHRFYNTSEFTFEKLKAAPDHLDHDLQRYIDGFSKNVRDIFQHFEFTKEIEKMNEANVLYLIISKFCDVDLHPRTPDHPDGLDNIEMGELFENLIHRFNELANEEAGDYFTPREVIHLMVEILFNPDDEILTQPHIAREMLDPACGTGGMLAEAQNHLRRLNETAQLYVYGQDFNDRAYAIAASDLLIKETEQSRIEHGDSLINDQFEGDTFDYFLANPPFGVNWKKQRAEVEREHEEEGFDGRFGAGTPRVSDGSFLFLQHMISKFEPYNPDGQKYGSRLGIVFSGSPLFSGVAGSGESKIRRWIIENDWLEAIIALPEQIFYNTGIGTYVWVLSNRNPDEREGKIQLIDARDRWEELEQNRGDKRRRLGDDDIEAVVKDYGAFEENDTSKIFDNEDFGFTRVYVERPLRLRFQITKERKANFLDAYPQLLDDVEAIDDELGREEYENWNEVWRWCRSVLKERGSSWRKKTRSTFRDVFTNVDEDCAPVIDEREKLANGEPVSQEERNEGWFVLDPDDTETLPLGFEVPSGRYKVTFESNTDLKDYEYVPLKDDVNRFFEEEVLPYVPDAWMNREKDRIGYEINFTRHFHEYEPPRDVDEIDAELKMLEDKIADMLQEVTT